MKTLMRGALLAAGAVTLPPLAAQTPGGFDAAKAFGAREDVRDVSLSPDGTMLALVRSQGPRGAAIDIVPVAGGAPKRILGSAGDPERIMGCTWSTNTRLLCNVYIITDLGDGNQGFTRRIAVDADGKNVKLVSARDSNRALGVVGSGGGIIDMLPEDGGSAVLMTRYVVPEENSQGTRITEDRLGLGVDRVDTVDLKRKQVEAPRRDAVEYISDGHGAVRIMGLQPQTGGGYDANFVNYTYRKPGSRDWLPLSKVTTGYRSTGFNPYAVDRDLNVAYGFEALNGRQALYKMALDGSLKKDLVFADRDVDVDGLVRLGRANRVVGVSYATDKRVVEFFDPDLKKLRTGLGKALPKLPNIGFADASADESKLVMIASSDVSPGGYYLYDKKTRGLSEIMPIRPQLDKVTLAETRHMTFPAGDGTQIPGYLTLPVGSNGKGLPAIVMPHGGPESRDEWGFDWLVQFFASRGYAVLQPNFRGSTGYGEQWFQDNGFKSWKTAVGDVDDAGRWLVKQGIADPAKLAIVGWSYGGYAALQSGVLDPGLYRAIVAIAPVSDLRSLRESYINYTSYKNMVARIGEGAHLTEGSPAQNPGRFTAPVLMFHGTRDQNVPIAQARLMETRLKGANKPVELVTYPRLDHQLDDSAARADMLAKSDAFLRKSLGM